MMLSHELFSFDEPTNSEKDDRYFVYDIIHTNKFYINRTKKINTSNVTDEINF